MKLGATPLSACFGWIIGAYQWATMYIFEATKKEKKRKRRKEIRSGENWASDKEITIGFKPRPERFARVIQMSRQHTP